MKKKTNRKKFNLLNNLKGNLTWLILPIILLLALVLIGVLIVVGNKEEDSKESKESSEKEEKIEKYLDYKNEYWSFEVKYPKNWDSQEEIFEDGLGIGFLTPYENDDDRIRENVSVSVYLVGEQNFDSLIAQTIEGISKDPNANLMDYSKVIVSGHPAYKLNHSYSDYYGGKLVYLRYLIDAGDKWYQVLYVALESTYSQYLPEAQAIIDSFVIK